MTVVDRFCEFFAAVNGGARPYPWQQALAERVAETGRWPDIAAPTGSGKSSVVDAHVFLVAEHAAGRLPVRPPRRLVLVAPRRVLVDDQFDRAMELSRLLSAADRGSPLGEAAGALDRLSLAGAGPLPVWRLRGGVLPDNGWRLEPAACQVICSTPQMWGSRLLLRGFGASRASRNIEGGLLGHDAVVIIDEAHLHERLVDTARNAAARSAGTAQLQVVAMSATRPAASGQIGLSEADLADPVLSARVRAPKTIELVEAGAGRSDVESEIVRRAQEAAVAGTVGVFVNDVPSALSVASALEDDGSTVELLCGRLRAADVARLRVRRPTLLSPAGDAEVDFLVSTQSLEVGVDLDLPAMVTSLASASALAQRAGRCNRSGSRPAATFTVVIPAAIVDGSGPYCTDELEAASAWLQRLGESISPEAVASSNLPLPERMVLPALRRADLETLAMTSDALSADPDPLLYLEDPQEFSPEVGIVARRHLSLDPTVVRAALLACPPRSHEVATLRLGRAVDRVLEAVSGTAWVVRTELGVLTAERLGDDRLRPGDTLVVPHGAPICTAGVLGVSKGAGDPFDDVLDEAPEGAAMDAVAPLPVTSVAPIVEREPALGSRAARTALAEVVSDAGDAALAARLRRHRRLSELELVWCGGAGDATVGLLVFRDLRARAEQAPLVSATDPVTVDDHQRAVESRMSALICALAVTDVDSKRLAAAAGTHDEGKRHPRFQTRMGAESVPLAKPLPGHVPDRGDGWRHEQLSAAYAAAATDGDPLVVTLVAGHHGRGRALFDRDADGLLRGWSDCPPRVVEWTQRLFGELGSYETMRRDIQRDLGVHRLAWLEALLRCADVQVSRDGG